jgi:FixJ family two-component response regulator
LITVLTEIVVNQNLFHLIDEDAFIRSTLDMLLTAAGFVVETDASPEDFLRAGFPSGKRCVLTDLQMPGGVNGIGLLHKIVRPDLGWPVIIMTAATTERDRETASRLGTFDFLEKPFCPDALIGTVRNAVESLNAVKSLPTPTPFSRAITTPSRREILV